MRILLLLLLMISIKISGFSQSLRGGELSIDITSTQIASLNLSIYNENLGLDSVIIDWGDGSSSLLFPLNSILPNTNIFVSRFNDTHQYDSLGKYKISVVDSFIIENVNNISNSGNKYLKIQDSLFIHDFSNEQPIFFSQHNTILTLNNGAIIHDFFPIEYDGDYFTYELIPFTDEGYSFPFADSLSVGSLGLYWDSPQEIGTYAFAIKANEFRLINNEILKLSTKTRFMMIDIDSSMLVSNKEVLEWKNSFEIFPNPSSNEINISLENHSFKEGEVLILTNVFGQTLHQSTLPYFEKNWTHQLDVSEYPSGTYFLTLQSGENILTRKFVIQR